MMKPSFPFYSPSLVLIVLVMTLWVITESFTSMIPFVARRARSVRQMAPDGFWDSGDAGSVPEVTNPKSDSSRKLTWKAAASSSVRVRESIRSCEEYMRLPATEYSVLAADQVTRLSDTEFKFNFPALNFFGNKIQPILYVDVNVLPDFNRSEIVVRRAETIGSEAALLVNGSFSINAVNVVFAGTDNEGRKTLNSETTLNIDVTIPPSALPLRVIQSTGNFLMQSSLNIIVPTFTRILSSDFTRWSAGNNTRSAVEGAQLYDKSANDI